jgi:predicted transposase/invertase (TIGR01784 family)
MSDKPLISFDYAIKYLLKDKGDYDIVEGFISALLKSQGYGPVKIHALMDTESNKEAFHLKKSLADLVVEDTEGQKYIVEIERAYTEKVIHKACFNSSRLIVDSISTGLDFTTIRKVFHVSLLYFHPVYMDHPLAHGKTIFKTLGTKDPIELNLNSPKGEVFDLNILPEYFIISVPLFDNVIRQEIDEWLYVMKNSETQENFKSPYMKKVAERLNIVKMNDAERTAYYRYMKEAVSETEHLQAAENRGRAEGRAEGMAEMVRNMLSRGASPETIAHLTGLTLEEIKSFLT